MIHLTTHCPKVSLKKTTDQMEKDKTQLISLVDLIRALSSLYIVGVQKILIKTSHYWFG